MDTPSFKEDHISQIPVLQLLQKLGYQYLSPDEAMQLRGNKTTNEGYIIACEALYNLITLGKSLEQSIDGDKKSFTLQYIDWKNLDNNVFHVTEEYSVMRSNSKEHYRPDLVLFVNGIPMCVIESKRPDMKEPLAQAISQQLRSQQEDGIRALFVYAQIIISASQQEAAYATNGTPEKFWAKWKEKTIDNEKLTIDNKNQFSIIHSQLSILKNQPLTPEQKDCYRQLRESTGFIRTKNSGTSLTSME